MIFMQLKLPIFSGNTSNYFAWRSHVFEVVDRAPVSQQQKFLKLFEFVEGQPKRIIEKVPSSEKAYEIAKAQLDKKYGERESLVVSMMNSIRDAKIVTWTSLRDIEYFSENLEALLLTLEGEKTSLENRMLLSTVKSKLPRCALEAYLRRLEQIGIVDNLDAIQKWLQAEITIRHKSFQEGPRGERNTSSNQRLALGNNTRSTPICHATERTRYVSKCIVSSCKEHHPIYYCPVFKNMDVKEKWTLVKQFKLCSSCLSIGHHGNQCKRNFRCREADCKERHHTLLHPKTKKNTNVPDLVETRGEDHSNTPESYAISHVSRLALRTVPVIISSNGRSIKLNALIDDCSTASYISENAANALELGGVSRMSQVSVVGGNVLTFKSKQVEFTVENVERKFASTVRASTTSHVVSHTTAYNWNELKARWPRLQNINFPTPARCSKVDLLLGSNATEVHRCFKEIWSGKNGPIARLGPLGWTVVGPTESSSTDARKMNNEH
jgi:hypothetical protein